MSDELPTIWPAEKHTLAKHNILTTYLKAWVPIMSRYLHNLGAKEQSLLFVDGFAGPGVYENDQDGSPILALKAILNHPVELPVPVRLVFIEKNSERHQSLACLINNMMEQIRRSPKIESVHIELGECEQIISNWLNYREKGRTKLGPAFLFLDQFGYSDVSMELIQRIMSQPLCEVFSYLNWANLKRFITDETKWSTISHTFGGDEWKKALRLEQREKDSFMLESYRNALLTKAATKYVWHFAMCDKDGKLIYWLFFCTNNLRGLEEMKKTMWKVDPTGGFRFSGKDNLSQFHLFKEFDDRMLAEQLVSNLHGKTLSVYKVKEFVLTETPAYKYKSALKLLEKDGLLKVVDAYSKRRMGTFPDEQMQVRFLAQLEI